MTQVVNIHSLQTDVR